MGYDMFWQTPGTAEEIVVSSDGQPEYFRLSGFGMSQARGWMHVLGMIDFDKDWLGLPQPVDFELSYIPDCRDIDGSKIAYDPDSPEERYLSAREAARDADCGGVIPLYKLRSNDGWLVTAAEIERSLAAYDARCPDAGKQPRELLVPVIEDDTCTGDFDIIDWWGEWVDYLRAAVGHGGFRVF